MQLLGFLDYREQGKRLASALDIEYIEVETHHFPDGESKVRLPNQLDDEIIFCRSLDEPNTKLIELFFCFKTARELGVKHITLVAPYLCYMRQDIAFNQGEAISQKIIGDWFGELVDKIITVDPHLHRVDSLDKVIPNTEAITLSAAPLMSDFLSNLSPSPILLGPDIESEQWVKQIAGKTDMDWGVARKIRHSDHNVEVSLPDKDVANRDVVIVDDIASTGHTIAKAAYQLKAHGANSVSCLVTHPLFAQNAEHVLTNAGVDHIWSTDSTKHHSNHINLAPMLAEALKR